MENIKDILDLGYRNIRRFGLLLVSSFLIIGASALAYDRLVYERALNVGTTSVTTGSGSTTSANLPTAIIAVVVFSVFVIGLSIFGLLREVSKHRDDALSAEEASGPTSTVPEAKELEELFLEKKEDEFSTVSG
jgi:hypothetical protein